MTQLMGNSEGGGEAIVLNYGAAVPTVHISRLVLLHKISFSARYRPSAEDWASVGRRTAYLFIYL
jgi:hypothetical protein